MSSDPSNGLSVDVCISLCDQLKLGVIILKAMVPGDVTSLTVQYLNPMFEGAIRTKIDDILGQKFMDKFPANFTDCPHLVSAYQHGLEGQQVHLGDVEYADEQFESMIHNVTVLPLGNNSIALVYENVKKQPISSNTPKYTSQECMHRNEELNAVLRRQQAYKNAVRGNRDDQEIVERVVASFERERADFSQDLHEGVAQTMAGLYMHLKVLESKVAKLGSAELSTAFSEVARSVKGSITEARELAQDIMPSAMTSQGLAGALAHLRDKYVHEIIVERVALPDPLRPDRDREIMLYRLLAAFLDMISDKVEGQRVRVTYEGGINYEAKITAHGLNALAGLHTQENAESKWILVIERLRLLKGVIDYDADLKNDIFTLFISFKS